MGAAFRSLRIADAVQGMRHVFVRDLVLITRIGVHAHEREAPQRVRINLDLAVQEGALEDRLENVVCYEALLQRVRGVLQEGHVNLVETLAERIAVLCLQDTRVRSARVRVEKLDIFPDVGSVGVEIERLGPLG